MSNSKYKPDYLSTDEVKEKMAIAFMENVFMTKKKINLGDYYDVYIRTVEKASQTCTDEWEPCQVIQKTRNLVVFKSLKNNLIRSVSNADLICRDALIKEL